MHFTPILGIALLAVGHVISHPAANPAGGIVRRDDECGNDDSGILKRAKCKKPVTCGRKPPRPYFNHNPSLTMAYA